ncbi:S8 family serine peptidase [Microbacteriaceae bacterium K1510]|nr:S8 family serine peptidase [Microbacteriaceae bacterium K1510]
MSTTIRVSRATLACLIAVTTLVFAAAESASAQNRGLTTTNIGRAPVTTPTAPTPPRGGSGSSSGGGGGYNGGGYSGGGSRGPGWGAVVPGIIMAVPSMIPPSNRRFVDDGTVVEDVDRPRRPSRRRAQRASNAPPANERRMVPDEVVIEVARSATPQQIDALQRRHRLTRIEQRTMTLTGTTMFRWRIPDRRSVATVVRALEADRIVASAQPNYIFTLQDDALKTGGSLPQYELDKLRLPQAHAIAKGDGILVAVIDSGIDASHPELAGSIANSFDTLDKPMAPHAHGTGIAGLIAAHGKLMGAAPGARLLAIRAFDPGSKSAQGTTFNILKGIDWASEHGARVINMSFAGPQDPAIGRSLAVAAKKNIVLIAAAGNAGAKSPPLYPAADPNVIAVTATDTDDKLFEAANRGKHIAIAAPGAQIMVAIPDGGYEVSSGTSLAAAEVSGIAALMLQHKPDLTATTLRDKLMASAKDLGPAGRDAMFGAGLADAYGALVAGDAPVAQTVPLPVERVSGGR